MNHDIRLSLRERIDEALRGAVILVNRHVPVSLQNAWIRAWAYQNMDLAVTHCGDQIAPDKASPAGDEDAVCVHWIGSRKIGGVSRSRGRSWSRFDTIGFSLG